MIKKILLLLVVAFVIIQFFRPEKNMANAASPNNITTLYPIPENVQSILRVACNDCHSNNTNYPWYNNIQPTAWFLADHVKDGKRHFNLDEFATYSLKRQAHKLDEMVEEIKKGDMPLGSYTLIHNEAKLTEEQKNILINWASKLSNEIRVNNNLPPEKPHHH